MLVILASVCILMNSYSCMVLNLLLASVQRCACESCTVLQVRGFGRSLRGRHDCFSGFSLPHFSFLKKPLQTYSKKPFAPSLEGLYLCVALYFCAFNSGCWSAFCWRPFFSKLILLSNIGIYLLKAKHLCLSWWKVGCTMKTRSSKLSSRVAFGACLFRKAGDEHRILLFLV